MSGFNIMTRVDYLKSQIYSCLTCPRYAIEHYYALFSFHRSNFNFNSSHDFFSMELQVMAFCQGFSKDWKSRKALQVFGYWVQAARHFIKFKKFKIHHIFSLSNMWPACLFLTFINVCPVKFQNENQKLFECYIRYKN